MSNYSILQQNTLAGLSEMAGHLYLKLIDQFEGHKSPDNERRAFLAACRFEEGCGETLDYTLRHAPLANMDDGTLSTLSAFFAERWRHNFMEHAQT